MNRLSAPPTPPPPLTFPRLSNGIVTHPHPFTLRVSFFFSIKFFRIPCTQYIVKTMKCFSVLTYRSSILLYNKYEITSHLLPTFSNKLQNSLDCTPLPPFFQINSYINKAYRPLPFVILQLNVLCTHSTR